MLKNNDQKKTQERKYSKRLAKLMKELFGTDSDTDFDCEDQDDCTNKTGKKFKYSTITPSKKVFKHKNTNLYPNRKKNKRKC